MYDRAKVYIKAGKGGNGSASFRREKFVPFGGPDGGDGGRGGSVYLVVSLDLNTLISFHYKQHYKAEVGGSGGGNQRHGKAGDNLYIPVPPGTFVRVITPESIDPSTGLTVLESETVLEADLTTLGQTVMIAKGGRGGLGNTHFATSTNQAPRISELGQPGEERILYLELKLIADVGLVGYPNVGKSTLLAASTAATPKIADYPFTTLSPNLGVVEIDVDSSFVLADIPGLIEGASEGAGLGLEFLRHVERTSLLIHVLDGTMVLGDDPQRDPLGDFARINKELEQYQPQLAEKPQIIAVNKLDVPEARAAFPDLKRQLEQIAPGAKVFGVAAVTGEAVRPLMAAAWHLLSDLREEQPLSTEEAGEVRILRVEEASPDEFAVERMSRHHLRVRGGRILRELAMTNFGQRENTERLNRSYQRMGLYQALLTAGAEPGDKVHIGEAELTWTEDNALDIVEPLAPLPPSRHKNKLPDPTKRKRKGLPVSKRRQI